MQSEVPAFASISPASSAKPTGPQWLPGDGRAAVFCCRELLEEGKATIPCLAERLTAELIAHICVSTRCRPISRESPNRQSRTVAHGPLGVPYADRLGFSDWSGVWPESLRL